MTNTVSRTVRLTTLAAATGTLVLGAGLGAGAASQASSPLLTFSGNTGSSALNVALHLPSPLNISLPAGNVDLGNVGVSLLSQTGSLQHDATGKVADLATSVSTLAGGTLFDQGGLLASLNQRVTANLAHPTATSKPMVSVPSQLAGVLSLGLPALKVSSVRSPLSTLGDSEVAGLSAGNLASLLPAGSLDALTSALGTALGTVSSTTSSGTDTVSGALSGVLSTIDSTMKQAGLDASTTQTLNQLKATLSALQADLPKILTELTNGKVVAVHGLTTTHSLGRVGAQEVSTVETKLASLSVLGGFVTLDGFDNKLTTEAGGVAGTAKVIPQPNVAKVTVGYSSELTAILGPNGLSLSGLGDSANTLLAPVNQALTTLQDALNGVLNVAGVDIRADHVTTNQVSADGSSAKGALSGLSIVVNPAQALRSAGVAGAGAGQAASAPNLLEVNIGAISADSAAKPVVLPATVVRSSAPAKPLAYTGAELPVSAGIASALLGAGVLLGRRRRSPAQH